VWQAHVVAIEVYGLSISPPTQAVRAMLRHKGLEWKDVSLLPGFHPIQLRLLGFKGTTVPAMKLDGRRVQRSLDIAREIDALRPEPPLYPPDGRQAVEEAERWGNWFQGVPRRIFRWVLSERRDIRTWMAAQAGMPAPGLAAALTAPVAHAMARKSHTSAAVARREVEALPGHLDHIDRLIADGVIGGEQPNAADFQILATVRALSHFHDYQALLEGRPALEHARRRFPRDMEQVPPMLPREWLN
jgi:glutathione S-transferase